MFLGGLVNFKKWWRKGYDAKYCLSEQEIFSQFFKAGVWPSFCGSNNTYFDCDLLEGLVGQWSGGCHFVLVLFGSEWINISFYGVDGLRSRDRVRLAVILHLFLKIRVVGGDICDSGQD